MDVGDLDYPRAVLIVVAVFTVIAVVAAASTSNAAFGAYNRAWDGASDLRATAAAVGVTHDITDDVTAYEAVDANATVAVVLGPDRGYEPEEAARVRSFVEAGGTLVVADDFGPGGNQLLAGVGASARIDGRLLRDERNFDQSPAMPIAANVTNHTLTRGVQSVTLNHGSVVRPNEATVLVRSSSVSYLDTNRNEVLDENETLASYPVVTVERVEAGRVVVVGDPSALINVMLERDGNRAFVRAVFAAHDHVLLDYSHTVLPPLVTAVMVLRDSVVLQLLLGGLGLCAVALLDRRPAWLRDRWQQYTGGTGPDTPRVGRDDLVAVLERRYPDWEEERVTRVVEGLLRNRD